MLLAISLTTNRCANVFRHRGARRTEVFLSSVMRAQIEFTGAQSAVESPLGSNHYRAMLRCRSLSYQQFRRRKEHNLWMYHSPHNWQLGPPLRVPGNRDDTGRHDEAVTTRVRNQNSVRIRVRIRQSSSSFLPPKNSQQSVQPFPLKKSTTCNWMCK